MHKTFNRFAFGGGWTALRTATGDRRPADRGLRPGTGLRPGGDPPELSVLSRGPLSLSELSTVPYYTQYTS